MVSARQQALGQCEDPREQTGANIASDVWEPLLGEAHELAWDFAQQAYRSNAEIPPLHRQTLSRLREALEGSEPPETRSEPPNATEANGEATGGPWEYQIVVKIPDGPVLQTLAYGPYPNLATLQFVMGAWEDEPTSFHYQIQRRRPTPWETIEEGDR